MTDQKMTSEIISVSISQQSLPKDQYIEKLTETLKELPYNGASTFLSTPVLIGDQYVENSQRLCTILNSVLVLLAYNYMRDGRLQQVYQLDNELIDILSMAEGTPYEVGMFRPDFIFDTNGQPKICEIGCRYPMNGWLISAAMNQATSALANVLNPSWNAVAEQNEFLQEFSDRYDHDDTLYLIRKDKKSYKTDYLLEACARLNLKVKDIQPEDLQIVDGDLKVGDDIARQFFLEMDREELRTFDKAVLKAVIQSGRCINDVRTIILVHDKRVLSVLYNQQIMGSYINMDDHKFLFPYLIPSFTIQTEEDQKLLYDSTDNWVLKKNSGGRGVDMYIKNDCSKETWDDIVKNKWNQYMVQPYIQQKKFNITINNEEKQVNLVGLDLFFNGKSFGPGLFRASEGNSANVANGNSFILTCVVDSAL